MKKSKEIEQRILFKRTINEMNKFINNLEEQKKKYLETAKKSKEKGLEAQLNLSLNALKSIMLQEQRAQEMLLNFEITNGMKDMAAMTQSFLKGMGTVSKEMAKLTKNKDFTKVQKQFEEAIIGMEVRTEQIDAFLDSNQSTFENISSGTKITNEDILSLIDDDLEEVTTQEIEAEIKKIRDQIEEK